MVFNPPGGDKHQLLASVPARYARNAAATLGVDELLGLCDAPPAHHGGDTPTEWVDFGSRDASCLDAWAEAFGIGPNPGPGPPSTAPVAAPPPQPAQPPCHAHNPPGSDTRPAAWCTSPPAFPHADRRPVTYPKVGGGFDCTRDGARIVLPPIRWPLLSPPLAAPIAAIPVPEAAMPVLRAMPLSDLPKTPTDLVALPEAPAPAWSSAVGYRIPEFHLAEGERLRQTREFPVLTSGDSFRRVWHYCHVMSQHGVFAGHFEVQALSRADVGRDALQRRIIVYSREASSSKLRLAMDTHPDGPPNQPRLFLLHDAQANHYQLLQTGDTTRPQDELTAAQACGVESGGAGDCLFFSVARGLGLGGHNQQAATRLRRMAVAWLFHHPEATLNGDTVALFVSKL